MPNSKLPSLNGLRALSIILVIFHHLVEHHYISWQRVPFLLAPFTRFIEDGQLGVNVFFVISGFLITSLLIKEENKSGSISLKNFYMRRVIRIFPAYYFLLFVYFLLQSFGIFQITGKSWLTAITYTKYFNWQRDWQTAHAWSLSVEEHFYLIWPFVFLLGKTIRKVAAVFLIMAVPFVRVYLHYHPIEHINDLTLFTRIDSIAYGCLAALYKDQILSIRHKSWSIFFRIAFIGIFSLPYFPYITDKINISFIWIPLGLTYGTISNLFIATIMMYSIFGPHNVWFRLLNSKVLNYIGLLSYSIYLWQQVFLDGSSSFFTSFPFNIGFVLIAALFSYYLIEKPFLKLKSNFYSGDKKTDNIRKAQVAVLVNDDLNSITRVKFNPNFDLCFK